MEIRTYRPVEVPPRVGEEADSEREAALRQLSLQRLMGYGVEYSDAVELRRQVEGGASWQDAAAALADQNLQRIDELGSDLSELTRASLLLRASACLRQSQIMMLVDSDERRSIYRRAAKIFAEGVAADPRYSRVVLRDAPSPLVGWLVEAGPGPTPCVVVWGGVDGWAMDLCGLAEALARRGISAFLIDGPGQGETRFDHGGFLSASWADHYRAAVGFAADRAAGASAGVLGNSMGGNFALRLAAIEDRVSACCNNGALRNPLAQSRGGSFFRKMHSMCGDVSEEEARRVWRSLELTPDSMSLSCPLLIVQGGMDPLVAVEDSELMLKWGTSDDKRMDVFSDGDHCIYNHPSDKDNLIADWFASRLLGGDA